MYLGDIHRMIMLWLQRKIMYLFWYVDLDLSVNHHDTRWLFQYPIQLECSHDSNFVLAKIVLTQPCTESWLLDNVTCMVKGCFTWVLVVGTDQEKEVQSTWTFLIDWNALLW